MADSISSPDKTKKHTHHRRGESHGLRDDIDEATPINDVKGPSVFERAKEEVEAIVDAIHHKKGHKNHHSSSHVVNWDSIKAESNSGKSDAHSEAINKQHEHHHGESHGLRDDLDEETPINDVKAPSVFERAKEEFEAIGEAIGEAIHHKKEPNNNHDSSASHFENWDSIKAELNSGKSDAHSGKDGNGHNFIEKAKEEIASLVNKGKSPSHHHDNETHGRNDDIDENTPIEQVKGPSVFARAKDEFEALVGAIHQKKKSNDSIATPKKNDGFTVSLGKGLEKMCSPKNHKHDD